jgi:VCBS repeat-containing protein
VDNSAVQYLGAGQSKVDSFTVSAADGTRKAISFTINGVNDAAVVGDPTSASVTEDLAVAAGKLSASGTLTISDADQGEASFQTSVTGAAGNLGALTLAANGAYTYAVDNSAVQYLGAGQSKVDSFTVSTADGTGKAISFTINGVASVPSASITAGSIAFVGLNSANPDNFAFVALRDIGAGQSVFFTDGGYTGTTGIGSATFRTTEGFLQWTAPKGGLEAGSVVLVTGGDGGAPSVALDGSGADAGGVKLLANSTPMFVNFAFSVDGDSLTAFTTTGGTHLTGKVNLVAFMDFGVNPYGAGSAQTSSIPTITGGQVLDLANLDNAILKATLLDPDNGVAFYSNAANYTQQNNNRYDLTAIDNTAFIADSQEIASNSTLMLDNIWFGG